MKVSTLKEVIDILSRILRITENSTTQLTLQDVIQAMLQVQKFDITYLPEDIKFSLCGGLLTVKSELASDIFDYHMSNEFEANEEIIPIMREVVDEVFKKEGAVIV